jgi:hypothetical protein
MIIHTISGAVLVVDHCHWTPGAYLAVTKASGCGTVVAAGPELDTLIEKLTEIRDAASRQQEKAA